MAGTDGIRSHLDLWAARSENNVRRLDNGLIYSFTDEPLRWAAATQRHSMTDEDLAALEQMLIDHEVDERPGIRGGNRTNDDNVGDLKEAARGNAYGLMGAFHWSNSPQGAKYWADMHSSGEVPEDVRPMLGRWLEKKQEEIMVKSWNGIMMGPEDVMALIHEVWEDVYAWMDGRGIMTAYWEKQLSGETRTGNPSPKAIRSLLVPAGLWMENSYAWDLGLDGPLSPEIIEMLGSDQQVNYLVSRWGAEIEDKDGIVPWEKYPLLNNLTDVLLELDPGHVQRAVFNRVRSIHTRTYVGWGEPELADKSWARDIISGIESGRDVRDMLMALAVKGHAPRLPEMLWLHEVHKPALVRRMMAITQAPKTDTVKVGNTTTFVPWKSAVEKLTGAKLVEVD